MKYNVAKILASIAILAVIFPIPAAIAQPSAGMYGADSINTAVSAVVEKVMPKVAVEHFTATVTAYNSEVGQTDSDPFTAANGHQVYDGMLACSREYSFGTQVTIGSRTYTCGDRMASKFDHAVNLSMKQPRFDIWMPSHSAAMAWGKRNVEVTVKYTVD